MCSGENTLNDIYHFAHAHILFTRMENICFPSVGYQRKTNISHVTLTLRDSDEEKKPFQTTIHESFERSFFLHP